MSDTITKVMTEYTFAVEYKGEEYEVQTDGSYNVKNIYPARPSMTSKDEWSDLWVEIRDCVELELGA